MQKRSLSTRDMVFIGVFAAMCALGTTLKIPFGVGAMIHLGSAVIYTIAILYGGVYAGLSGAIGSALFDLVMGFSPYTLWSFVIKGLAGFIAGSVATGMWPGKKQGSWVGRAILGCLLAAAWTLAGYTVAWWQITGKLTTAFANAPSSLLTSGVGLVVALLLASRLRNRINP